MQSNEWDLPDPPGIEPVKGPRLWRVLATIMLSLALLLAAWILPIPIFYAYLPGPVEEIESLITIGEATTYSSEGKLLMTTVSVDTEVTLFEAIQSFFDEDKAIVDKNSVTGGVSLEELRRDQREQMQGSQQHAREVALGALGMGPTADGVRVQEVVTGYPADGVLREGDEILAVDGVPVQTSCDVGRLIDKHEIGDTVELTIRRDGSKRSVEVGTVPNPRDGRSPIVGVAMRDLNFRFEAPVEVTFDTGRIAGPSAGLMLSLGLYDRLTPGDLTAGRIIAGTGEISCDGGVGPIGGVEQKVAGAELEGAEIFLAPSANVAAAKEAAEEIEVVAISTFSEAVEYLEGLEQ